MNPFRQAMTQPAACAFALVLASTGGSASAALPGLPPAPPEQTEQNVRPSDKTNHPATVAPTAALRGSLFGQGASTPIPVGPDGQQIGGSGVSFTAVSAAKPKKFQKNDIITVVVAVNATSATSSQSNSEKKQDFNLQLQQFAQLATSASGVPTLNSVGNPSKLPQVQFNYDNNRQNQADQQRSDTVSDRFAAIVVDVKPNGTMVLEATQQVAMDKEVLHYKMSGICRAADVTADDTILSTQLANLDLSKQTTGEVRDGVKRGWLNSLIDKFGPF